MKAHSLDFPLKQANNVYAMLTMPKEMLKATYRIVEENFISEDRVDNKDTKSPVNITKHFQRLAADTGTSWLSASCSKVLKDVATDGDITECVWCNSPASCNTKIERLTEVIVLEIVKKKMMGHFHTPPT